MKKYLTRKKSPKAKTSSMFYKNKKTIRKIETPLCSDNLKKKLNKSQISQKEDLFDEINSNVNDENIIKPRERRASTNVTNSAFSYQYLLNNNNNKVNINDDDNQYNNINMNPNNDNKIELINLTNEKINLNNNNIKLLQLLNENNQKNIELKDYIEEYRKKGLLTKAKFLRHLEKLKHRSKEINFDSEIFQKKKTNYNNINDIKKENEYLIKKIKIKNNDFQNLYDFVMEIISYSEPYVKEWQNNVNELSVYKNNKLQEVETSFDMNISGEIIKMKNDYEKLKIKYNELSDKIKNEDDKEESQKQKVKFVVKNISKKTIKEYEEKIKKLKDENNQLINDYKTQENELKNELNNLKSKKLNKDKEFEELNDKYQKIIQSINEKIKNNNVISNEDINI